MLTGGALGNKLKSVTFSSSANCGARLTPSGKSLLPAGILDVGGDFEMGEAITVRDSSGGNFARGLSNYASQEVQRIKGRQSRDIEEILGYKDFDVVIHRNNLVLL